MRPRFSEQIVHHLDSATPLPEVSAAPGVAVIRAKEKARLRGSHSGIASVLILVAFYLFPGLLGHDPWKQDETYVFGAIQHLLDTGDWVVPMVAGEPFMEKPPLYYWVAAGFARLLSGWLPLHDGARLATGFFMALTCGAIGWAARLWWGSGHGRFGVLSLLACLGIVFYGHLMLTDIALLAGFAIASCGFALARTRALAGGLMLGIGVGAGFLAKGMLALGVLGLSAPLLPLLFRNWRDRTCINAMAIALLVASPWLLVWPLALYLRSPSLFMDWLWENNIGRFLGFSVPMLGAAHTEGFWSQNIPWFTFPALPLACVTLWRHRKSIATNAALQFSLVTSGVLMAVLWLSASARPNYALPLLVPVCLLAAPAAAALPPWADRVWDWSARALFGALAAVIWYVWAVIIASGTAPDWPVLSKHLPLDFVPPLGFGDIVVAPLLTLLAGALIWRQSQRRGRGIISWVTGIALCWALISTLWLEWIDYAKSYRSVFASMQAALPDKYRCVASSGLGESERAMLRYVLGMNTQRREIAPGVDCDLLLVEGLAQSPPDNIDLQHWKLIWDGARPANRDERFRLFSASGAQS